MPLRIAALLFLSLGTILFSVTHNRHEVSAENLLRNLQFQDNFQGWLVQTKDSVSARHGIITVFVPPKNNNFSASIAQTVDISPGQHTLFLSCEARALNVTPGSKPWEKARVIIVPLTSEGKIRFDVPHTLALLDKTTPWKKFEQIFYVPKENKTVSIIIELLNASGTLEVRNLSLRSAIEDPSFQTWRHALMLSWLVIGLWVIGPLFQMVRYGGKQAAVIIIGGAVLVGVLMPASIKYEMTPYWMLPRIESPEPFRADLLQAAVPFSFHLLPAKLDIYKLVHFFMFSLMGYLLVSQPRPQRISVGKIIWLAALFALATESMQVLAAGRDGSLADMIIDLIGTCFGLLIAAMQQRKIKKPPENTSC